MDHSETVLGSAATSWLQEEDREGGVLEFHKWVLESRAWIIPEIWRQCKV